MKIFTIFKHAGWLWYDTDADHRAAAVAYYAPLALLPLLYIAVSVATVVFPQPYVLAWFANWSDVLGAEVVALLEQSVVRLADATDTYQMPMLATLLFSSIIVVALNILTTGFHLMWGIPHRGPRGWVEKCVRSVVFVVVLQAYFVGWLGLYGFVQIFPGAIEQWLLFLFAIAATALLCSVAYTILPWRAPTWRGRLWGGVVAGSLLVPGQWLVGWYIASVPAVTFLAAAGEILVALLWMYAVIAIVYYGAAFAHAYDVVLRRR